jgi:tRNA-specific 2-thiouridylase
MSLFPLGGMTDKRAVRDLAQRLGLGVAEKPDSQDICFVPSGAYTDVVAKFRPDALAPGEIVSSDGRIVGTHDGIARYTVGQGKRLGNAAVVDGQRQFVVATEPGRRRIVVGPRDSGTHSVSLRDVNWLISAPSEALRCTVKLRAHESPRSGCVRTQDGHTVVELVEPALPAPGQACVFYHEDRVLGGGIIARMDT